MPGEDELHGFAIAGPDEASLQPQLDEARYRVAFYGSTRTYWGVWAQHGLEDLGMRLHKLSLDGRWQEMQEIITDDDLLTLAETCTYDDYPEFVQNRREYASQMGFGMPTDTAEQKVRAQAIMAQLQQVETPGVPAGL